MDTFFFRLLHALAIIVCMCVCTYVHVCMYVCTCVYVRMYGVFTGQGVKFNVTVEPFNQYPFDLYMLMDVSGSLEDDVATLQALSAEIGTYILYVYVRVYNQCSQQHLKIILLS